MCCGQGGGSSCARTFGGGCVAGRCSSCPYDLVLKNSKTRPWVVGIFPNESAIVRLIGAVLLEANDEWQLQHRYMQTEAMAELTPPLTEAIATQFSTVAA